MCGRFTLKTKAKSLAHLFHLSEVPTLEPRYNIAPTQPVPAVRQKAEGDGRELVFLRWGLVPSWAKDPKDSAAKCINARAETVADKPTFRAAFRQRRCLIPADGFYEWKALGPGKKKQPFCFTLKNGRAVAFAGLWEGWHGADGEALQTCTILTTEANGAVRPVHERMPVILDPRDYGPWLDPRLRAPGELLELLQSSAGGLVSYPVSTRVNSAQHDDPGCIEPAA
jgi:putative SOS response-associated peptidase YedK